MTEPAITESPRAAEGANDGPKAPHPGSHWRDGVLALSIAHLCFIQSSYGLLFERNFGYFNRIPVNRASLAALLINMLAMAVVLWGLGRIVWRVNRRWLFSVASLAICAAALVPLNFARTHVWNVTGGRFDALLRDPVVLIGVGVLGLAALWLHRPVARVLTVVYMLLSPMVIFTAGNALWKFVRPPTAPVESRAPASPSKPGMPKVVWLLLDELDQRIAFEARPADVAMPELSRFYSENLRATNAFPPGGSTQISVPALTIGREVRSVAISNGSDLTLNGSVKWSETENVFARAREIGFSCAVIGWYHPYGRVLGRHLDRCEWYAYPPFEPERGRTIAEAALNQIGAVFSQFQQRRLHIRNFESSRATALAFVTNNPAALTFLHLPVPHHPGIYDPKRGRLTAWRYSRSREYLENLTLADRLFGDLRHAMEQAGAWRDAWIIVSSDHWWRGAAAHDGKVDHRVPFIVKAPGENASAVYDRKFNTALTYHLVLGILKGELTGAGQLPHWLDTFRTDPPSAYAPTGEPL